MPRMNRGKRPDLVPVSEEMRRTFALLAEEISRWDDVSTRLMFGFRAVYRGKDIFAMLPDKRSLEVPNAIAYKDGGKWMAYEVKNEAGIRGALSILERAYATVRRFSDSP
jgi:hypothetical protein